VRYSPIRVKFARITSALRDMRGNVRSMTTTTTTQVAGWRPRDTFGARLRLIRGELGLDISEAAERCDVPIATWSNWERKAARPRDLLDAVLKIENALRVDRDWLMWGGPLDRRDPTRADVWTGGDRRRKGYPGYRGQNASKVTPLFPVLGTSHRKAA
jgi:transcriptional regulator with XRE-family HTH domain